MAESEIDMVITEKQFKGNLGMFLVCAELSKRNLIAMPTSGNLKGYDIIVLNPRTKKALPLQVKCGGKKGFPLLNSHWKDYEQTIENKILSDFVFVDISDLGNPRYFIVSEKEMKDIIRSSIILYSQRYQQKKTLTWEQMIEEENNKKRNPHVWAIDLKSIKEYENKWDTITNNL